jgi:hypothetical protein
MLRGDDDRRQEESEEDEGLLRSLLLFARPGICLVFAARVYILVGSLNALVGTTFWL